MPDVDRPAELVAQSQVSSTRRVYLVGLLVLGILFLLTLYSLRQRTPVQTTVAELFATPTPLPPTNTFVDSLRGTVLYFADGTFHELSLPGRATQKVIGIRDESEQQLPQVEPHWSVDGSTLFLVRDQRTVVAIDYESGRFSQEYSLRFPVPAHELTMSVSPFTDVLALGFRSEQGTSLQFVDVATGQELGFYDRCEPRGVWVAKAGFVAKCTVGTQSSIVVIGFDATSSQMVTIAREQKNRPYRLLSSYDEVSVMLGAQQSNSWQFYRLDVAGKLTTVPPDYYKGLGSTEYLIDPERALANRIEEATKLGPVEELSVDSSDRWVVFRVKDTMYVAPLTLSEKPYELGKGSLLEVRPNQ